MKKNIALLGFAGLFGLVALVGVAAAQGMQREHMDDPGVKAGARMGISVGMGMGMMDGHMMPGVVGTVTAVNGNIVSVQGRFATTTIYSVDVTNAKIIKNNATTTVSSIAVGDTVMVHGTVTGTSVVALTVFDGNVMGGKGMDGRGDGHHGTSTPSGTPPFGPGWDDDRRHPSGTPPFASGTTPFGGDRITGKVTAVNASSLTVSANNGTTYMVDITGATVIKQGSGASSASAILVGDTVNIQGTINGTSVTAKIVVDNVVALGNATGTQGGGEHGGVFGGIASFIANLFHLHF